jgi:ATP-dependent Zn protease
MSPRPNLQRAIAHHEAGHAVVARVLNLKIDVVTTLPGDPAMYHRQPEGAGVAHFEALAKVALAGRYAQRRYNARTAQDVRQFLDDRESALRAAGYAVYLRDGGTLPAPGGTALITFEGPKLDEVRTLLLRCEDDALELVIANWPAIERVAQALLRRPILTGDEVDALIADSQRTHC